ncbi:MAG: Conserved rane protein of unknown function [Frankiales bacterium]|nr:Conserved rane protein of unknown function [Frankiales bacterium]
MVSSAESAAGPHNTGAIGPVSQIRVDDPGHPVSIRGQRGIQWPLDQQVAQAKREATGPWPAAGALWALLAVAATIAASWAVGRNWSGQGTARTVTLLLIAVAAYAVMAAVSGTFGRRVAATHGGAAIALGVRRPRWRDLTWVGPGLVGSFLARSIVVLLVIDIAPQWRHVHASNVQLHGRPVWDIIATGVLAVLIAPPVEEFIFRGLLLRTLMQQLPFWPAAVISSVLFGAFHTYELQTLAGAVILGASTAAFGLGQCFIVRFTGQLAPAIAVHALSNLIALVLSVYAVGQ